MKMNLPEPIRKLVDRLSELPSLGPRHATRLIFYLLHQGPNAIHGLARGLDDLKRLKLCSRCFFVHGNAGELCGICGDHSRNHGLIAVVEKETDLLSIENTGKFTGRYMIIGTIPRTGMFEDWQKLRVQSLKNFIEKDFHGKTEEIILAFNPTAFGNVSASLISKELAPYAKKITRLGRGLPTGGEIEFADDETLGEAIDKRR